MSIIRHVTFYLVAWLCLSSFLLCFTDAKRLGGKGLAPSGSTGSTGSSGASSTGTTTIATPVGNVCIPAIGKFITFTQTELGTIGTKAVQTLTQYFSQLFPQGLLCGQNVICGVNNLVGSLLGTVTGLLAGVLQIVLYTVNDVVNFLPQLTAPGCLTAPLVNPQTCPAGSLAGDAIATALNVALDANIAGFATAAFNLSDLVFIQGPCAGLSVRAVLNIANSLIGNQVSNLLSLSPLAIAANVDVCLASCNQNFFDGLKADVYLALPGFNLQALLNIKLPAISASAAITATLSAPVSTRGINAFLNIQLLGLNVNAALTLGNSVSYPCWQLDLLNLNVNLNVALTVSNLAVAVPSTLSGLLSNVVSDVVYVVDDVLCLVNYLLNFCPSNAQAIDIQAAIFLLLNPNLTLSAMIGQVPALSGCNQGLVLAIVADVKLNGVGFVPAPGQIAGVVVGVNVAGISARVLLEVNVPALDVSISTPLCIAL